jgi:hypothetical protein
MNGILYITGALADGGVTTAKLAADAVTGAKLADNAVVRANITDGEVISAKLDSNAVTTSKINNNAVTTDKIADDAVTAAKIADDAVNGSHLADAAINNTAIIADNVVSTNKLTNGTSSNDGKFLRANNGAAPTFETVSTDLVADTSPQLGGDLDANGNNIAVDGGNNITIGDNGRLRLGNSQDLDIFHDGTNSRINNTTGKLMLKDDVIEFVRQADDTISFKVNEGGSTDLYHNHNKRIETTNNGALVQTEGDAYLTILADVDNNNGNNWPLIDFRVNNLSGTTEARIAYREDNSVLKFDIAGSEKVGINGNGLVFNGDTAAANALDDYEEGTYTPTFTHGFDSGLTYSVQDGYYRKIGTLVEFNFYIQVGSGSNDTTGGRLIVSLPFTQNSSSTRRGHGIITYHNIASASPNSDPPSLYIYGSGADAYSSNGADFAGGNGSNQASRYYIGGGHFYST